MSIEFEYDIDWVKDPDKRTPMPARPIRGYEYKMICESRVANERRQKRRKQQERIIAALMDSVKQRSANQ